MALCEQTVAAKAAQPLNPVATASNDPYHSIAEAIPGIIGIFNPDGRSKYMSRRWHEFTGSDLQPENASHALGFIHPEDRASGERTWKKSIADGQCVEAEVRLRRHDGVYRWHRVRLVPDHDAEELINRWVCVCIDIEEERKARQDSATAAAALNQVKEELEKTVARRTHELQEVVEQLEAFAYSIAHDMRAPLRAMHQYAQTVAQDFGSRVPDDAKFYLKKIMGASEKLDSLIREVLVYTRVSQGRIEMQPMNIERLLSDILIMHPHLHPPNVELTARLPLHTVMGDQTALTQAFSNLLGNAVKFVPEGRKPKVDIWTEEIGDKVRIYIKDNGIGIGAHDQERIFKMFERLQPDSKNEGSGIGLTIVRRAVERMGGQLGVESEVGKGTTFWIELKKGSL